MTDRERDPIPAAHAEQGIPVSRFEECPGLDNSCGAGRSAADGAINLSPGSSCDHSTRRDFLASTIGTVGSLVVAGAVLSQEVASNVAKGARAEVDWPLLRRRIKGEVVTANAANFAAARDALVWNAIKPDRSPDAIVRVKNEHDVIEVVNFARNNGLQVVLRGGGHTWCGLAVRHGGITIDLSALNESRIDVTRRTAAIQPVISNRDLARRLGEHGLAFPIGHCPTVKAGGYLLNGGMSWNMGHWGPAWFKRRGHRVRHR